MLADVSGLRSADHNPDTLTSEKVGWAKRPPPRVETLFVRSGPSPERPADPSWSSGRPRSKHAGRGPQMLVT
jgi:hypothetical protein